MDIPGCVRTNNKEKEINSILFYFLYWKDESTLIGILMREKEEAGEGVLNSVG